MLISAADESQKVRGAIDIDTLPARHAILDVIGCFLTNRCQIEKLLFYGYVFGRFGKLPIFGCFVPKIISPIHVASRLLPEGAGSDDMRELVEDEWPELAHKLPPKVPTRR
jgi:hypothetical protein